MTAPAATQSQSVRAEITAANQRFIDAFSRGDVEALARCYTPDAQLLPANSDVVQGTAAIADFWRMVLGLGIASGRLETSEIEQHEDTVIETGRYYLSTSSGDEADRGKYLVVWHRHDGEWRLHRDIWNTSKPAA